MVKMVVMMLHCPFQPMGIQILLTMSLEGQTRVMGQTQLVQVLQLRLHFHSPEHLLCPTLLHKIVNVKMPN
jgi:hypothetical protein